MANRLLASAKSMGQLGGMISAYYYGATITFVETDVKNIFDVHNLKGKIPGVRAVVKNGRWRFEHVAG